MRNTCTILSFNMLMSLVFLSNLVTHNFAGSVNIVTLLIAALPYQVKLLLMTLTRLKAKLADNKLVIVIIFLFFPENRA